MGALYNTMLLAPYALYSEPDTFFVPFFVFRITTFVRHNELYDYSLHGGINLHH
jgi:hypothetical protein